MSLIQIETPFNIDLEFEIAEVYKRLFAYLIDFTILLLYFTSMKYFYYGGFNLAGVETLKSHMGLDILTISIPMLLYSLVCEVMMHGQTIGKKILNIRIISLDGGEPSLSQYTIRWIFKVFEWPFFFRLYFFQPSKSYRLYYYDRFLGIGGCNFYSRKPQKPKIGRYSCQYGGDQYGFSFLR